LKGAGSDLLFKQISAFIEEQEKRSDPINKSEVDLSATPPGMARISDPVSAVAVTLF
jgi:hypothetical protein